MGSECLRKYPFSDRAGRQMGRVGLALSDTRLVIASPLGEIDGDEAIVGLMARHIAFIGERPVFYWGKLYLGSLEAFTAAPLFRLFDSSTVLLNGSDRFNSSAYAPRRDFSMRLRSESCSSLLSSGWRCDSSTEVTRNAAAERSSESACIATEKNADKRASRLVSLWARDMPALTTDAFVCSTTSLHNTRLLAK